MVKRFRFELHYNEYDEAVSERVADKDGEYILYADYATLSAEVSRLAQEVERLTHIRDDAFYILDAFERSEAAGYRSRDRQFAIDLLKRHKAALSSEPSPGEAGEPTLNLFGPYGWLNGCRGLSEESWCLESDPLEDSNEYFSIPLYALKDPFEEIGRTGPVALTPTKEAAPQEPTEAEVEAACAAYWGEGWEHRLASIKATTREAMLRALIAARDAR